MALSPSPKPSSKRVVSPQVENLKSKKKKAKRSILESQVQTPDLAPEQEQEQEQEQVPPPSTIRKRTKSPGVRVVGGRIYDSENGKTCHQCRQKTMDFVAACKGRKGEKPCTIKFCHKCLLNRYGEKAEEMEKLDDWKCPKCRGICNCSFCMKKKGHQPTGILVHAAKATGFQSVSEMLTVNGPNKENLSGAKDDSVPQHKELILPSGSKKNKKHKQKDLEDGDTNDKVMDGAEKKRKKRQNKSNAVAGDKSEITVQEGSRNDSVLLETDIKDKEAKINGTNKENLSGAKDDSVPQPHASITPSKTKKNKKQKLKETENGNSSDKVVDGAKKKRKKRQSKSNTLAGDKSDATVQEGSKETVAIAEINTGDKQTEIKETAEAAQKKKHKGKNLKHSDTDVNVADGAEKKLKIRKKKLKIQDTSNSIVLDGCRDNIVQSENNPEDETTKNTEIGHVNKKKPKRSRVSKKITDDIIKTEGHGGEDKKPMSIDESKQNTEAEVEILLPQGKNLKTVADIELSSMDVGPALQFLEFCSAFKEVLELKKGDSESVLRELTVGSNLRRRQYSPVVRFHLKLLSSIQKDMDDDEIPQRSPSSNIASWTQTLGKCISKSQCALAEIPLETFTHDGYDKLDTSKKLRLLNFLCEEALCTTDLRGWIEKQNEKFAQTEKDAKEKVLAAKDKEKVLKKQMRDDIANAYLKNGGAPLSISEHADLVSKIKSEVEIAHAEKQEALDLVPKKKQRSDAVRTEPVLLNEDGMKLWKLKGYSIQPNILLQDIGNFDKPEDKWFSYDAEDKEALDNYISNQRKKRVRSLERKKKLKKKVQPDTCTETQKSETSTKMENSGRTSVIEKEGSDSPVLMT